MDPIPFGTYQDGGIVPIRILLVEDNLGDVRLTREGLAEARVARANAYVTKPVDLDGFIRAIQAIEDFWLTIVRLPPSIAESVR